MRSVYYIKINVVSLKEDAKGRERKDNDRDRRDRMANIRHMLRKVRVS
jgi:hypothetical protein